MAAYYGLGIHALSESPSVAAELAQDAERVEKLTLFGCGLRRLEGLPALRRLEELVVSSNELGPSLGAALF